MKRFILVLLSFVMTASAQSTTTPKVGNVPPLNVQVAVGTQQRNERGSFYRKVMDIQGKLTLEATSKMQAIPPLEATLLVITMDTRQKYTLHREAYKVHTKETIPIPAANNGDRRQFTFASSTVSFDGYRDNSNVGGEIYKYYLFALKEKDSGATVDFRTNNVPFANFLKTHPEKREELLALSTGAEFPSELK